MDPGTHTGEGPSAVASSASKGCVATGQYSSMWVGAVVLFLGNFDKMEVEEKDREQVDNARERDKTRTDNERSNM